MTSLFVCFSAPKGNTVSYELGKEVGFAGLNFQRNTPLMIKSIKPFHFVCVRREELHIPCVGA